MNPFRPRLPPGVREIQPRELADRLARGEPTFLLDVREPDEFAICAIPGSALVPLQTIPHRLGEIAPPPGALLVTICHHGVRSLNAAAFLVQRAGHQEAASLAGGVEAWALEVDPSMPRY